MMLFPSRPPRCILETTLQKMAAYTPRCVMSFEQHSTLNRTQQLILAFFLFAWLALIVIVRVAPEVFYEQILRLTGSGERRVLPTLPFLVAICAFLLVLVGG